MNQKAIGYIRVSTTDQALEGVSLEAQRSRIDAWCLANGFDLVCVHEDAGISGGRADNRPGLQQAIEDACGHKAAIVVYSLSRLGRSMRDVLDITARLDKCGADLVSLSEKIDTTSAAGRMLFHILAALAQFERDLTAERTLAAMAHMRQNNRRISGRIRQRTRPRNSALSSGLHSCWNRKRNRNWSLPYTSVDPSLDPGGGRVSKSIATTRLILRSSAFEKMSYTL